MDKTVVYKVVGVRDNGKMVSSYMKSLELEYCIGEYTYPYVDTYLFACASPEGASSYYLDAISKGCKGATILRCLTTGVVLRDVEVWPLLDSNATLEEAKTFFRLHRSSSRPGEVFLCIDLCPVEIVHEYDYRRQSDG